MNVTASWINWLFQRSRRSMTRSNFFCFWSINPKLQGFYLVILTPLAQITSRNASKTYMEMVDNSYISSSDEVSYSSVNSAYITQKDSVMKLFLPVVPPQLTRLMERVELTFIKHFANGNHRKGMDTLRPKARRERHRISFSLGKIC